MKVFTPAYFGIDAEAYLVHWLLLRGQISFSANTDKLTTLPVLA